VVAVEQVGRVDSEEYVGAAHRVAPGTGGVVAVGVVGQAPPGRGEPRQGAVQSTRAVAGDHVADALAQEQLDDGRTGGAGPGDGDPHVGELLVDHPQRVGERGEYADRGAV